VVTLVWLQRLRAMERIINGLKSRSRKTESLNELRERSLQNARTTRMSISGSPIERWGENVVKVLIADDDPIWNRFLGDQLSDAGFWVNSAYSGREAVDQVRTGDYDVVLLDVLMPEMDGHAVLQQLRSSGNYAAILMVTCKNVEKDKIRALASGADDYLVKPVCVPELVARINAVLRRITNSNRRSTDHFVLRAGPFELDPFQKIVRKKGRDIHLTNTEFTFLELLMRRPGQVISARALDKHLANSEIVSDPTTIRVHITNLRRKLDDRRGNSCIRAVRGIGYSLHI
jgi:two-component system alkaline phosphatase synthesis response regulator PhoP